MSSDQKINISIDFDPNEQTINRKMIDAEKKMVVG